MKFVIVFLVFLSSTIADSNEEHDIVHKLIKDINSATAAKNVTAVGELISEDFVRYGCIANYTRSEVLDKVKNWDKPQMIDQYVLDSTFRKGDDGKLEISLRTENETTNEYWEATKVNDKYVLISTKITSCGVKNS